MGAELPMAIAIDGEYLPAGRTGKGVDCLPFHQLQMCIPPLVPAGIAAEAFSLPPRILCNGPATLLTNRSVCSGGQTVSPAERLHRVDGKAQLIGYSSIPCPVAAQSDNLLFLFVRHDGIPPENLVFRSNRTERLSLSTMETKKYGCP